MNRAVIITVLVATALIAGGTSASLAAQGNSGGLSLTVPASLQAGVSGAVKVRLPANIAAADGRVMFDKAAVEVVGIAPSGKGTALAPVDIDGGVAFGVYGLDSRGGATSFNIVFNSMRDGQLTFRVVVDAAANKAGQRIGLSKSQATSSLRFGRGSFAFAGPRSVSRVLPIRAGGALRDVVRDGLMSKVDLDVLRADWEQAHSNGVTCTRTASPSDANGDGCVDIVDLQAATTAQRNGLRFATAASTSDTSMSSLRLASGSDSTASSKTAAIAANAPTFTVTSTADTADARAGDGVCADSQGRCTLRAAVTESNWMKGDNRIAFNLSGSAPVVIQLTGTAPLLQDRSGGTEIDGYTQPGARVNTAQFGSNAVMGVEIRGTGGSPRGQGLRITSANNVIRGISFTNSYRPLYFDTVDAHDNLVAGNWFGFTSSGSPESYRGSNGIRINLGAHHNQIGTAALADRNVMGAYTHDIDLYGPGTDFNVIQGNLLCTTPSGMGEATCSTAVDHNFGPSNNLHGGTNPGERNIIGRTTLNGIEVSHGWDPDSNHQSTPTWQNNNNRIIGNWIGFRGDGSYSSSFRCGQNNPGSADNGNCINSYDGSNFTIAEGNYLSSAYDGIQFMSANATGSTARNNIIGESPQGQNAPVGRYGINIRGNTRSHVVEGNRIRNTIAASIAINQKDVTWIRLSRNIISDTSATAIFITSGANNNTPTPSITTATSVRAAGTGIAGATVEVYRASRSAGEVGLPVEFLGSGVVANNGTWSIPIVVATGARITALQITTVNNTSRLAANVTTTFQAPPPAPDAQFTSSQRASTLTVDFTDTSTNSPAQWSWNFGDGTTSDVANPSKTYGQAGQYTVSLTVSNAGGSDSVSHQVTVQEPPTAQTFAADAFGRTRGGWGSADVGGAYTLQGAVADYNVGSGAGTMRLPASGNSRSALLNSVNRRDVDIKVRVAVDKVAAGGAYYVYLTARRNTNNEYRPRILFNANGTVSVQASVVIGGSESALGSAVVVPGLSQGPNQFIWVRAQVTGASPTTVRVKAWADGQSEPAGWQFTATSSQAAVQVAGAVGIRTFVAKKITTAPVVFTFDDYSVVAAQ